MRYDICMAKKVLKKNSLVHVILIAVAVVLFWRGAWGLMDLYVFPDNDLMSYITSLTMGLIILFFTRRIADALD